MLGIIGTYRGLTYVPRLLDSLDAHTYGLTELIFVNDAPNPEVTKQLQALGRGEVVTLGGEGYNAAMQKVVEIGADYDDHAAFLEEDFYFTGETDFSRYAAHIDTHPYLSQIVFQRQPWFPVELRAGDMLRVYKNRGKQFKDVDNLLEHDHFFSCNPGVWNIDTFRAGWPEGEWSENLKRDAELEAGRKFAITKDIRTHHDGVRSGKDY